MHVAAPEASRVSRSRTVARHARRVLVAGASGTIGRVLVRELLSRGCEVTALCRPPRDERARAAHAELAGELAPATLVSCAYRTEPLASVAFRGAAFEAVYSCIASRGGGVADAWRVERDANEALLAAALRAGAGRFVLLSAICVQKPRLAFQHAKLAFEARLAASGITWTIVRPTAYFKSLAGQIGRVAAGKPFLVFGDGRLTACKPIAEADLARFLADCLDDPTRDGAILPIGGPGPALTPRDQGALLCELLGRPARFRQVSPRLFTVAAAVLGAAARLFPRLADKAEFARIGHYYATESMLLWDPERGCYDEAGTPEFGTESLREGYRRLIAAGPAADQRGEHALFDRRSGRRPGS